VHEQQCVTGTFDVDDGPLSQALRENACKLFTVVILSITESVCACVCVKCMYVCVCMCVCVCVCNFAEHRDRISEQKNLGVSQGVDSCAYMLTCKHIHVHNAHL